MKEAGGMCSLDLDVLKQLTAQSERLSKVAAELQPFLELLKEFDGREVLPMPTDRLIRSKAAAEILGVNQGTFNSFVRAGLIKPYFVNSYQNRFWVSDVKALAKEEPWRLKE